MSVQQIQLQLEFRCIEISFSFASRMIEQYNSLMMLKGELTHCPV